MKTRYSFRLFLILIVVSAWLAACGANPPVPGSTPFPPTLATVVPLVLPTATMSFTPEAVTVAAPTAVPLAVVTAESLGLLSGPGLEYGLQAYILRGDTLTILGQTDYCSWLRVSTQAGKIGWVSATYVTFSQACDDIVQAPIPSLSSSSADNAQPVAAPTLPTDAQAAADPTQSADDQSGSGSGGCAATDTIYITNETGTGLYITLNGPATYSLLLVSGSQVSQPVCPGTYTWQASGCGGSGSGSGTINSGDSLDLDCY